MNSSKHEKPDLDDHKIKKKVKPNEPTELKAEEVKKARDPSPEPEKSPAFSSEREISDRNDSDSDDGHRKKNKGSKSSKTDKKKKKETKGKDKGKDSSRKNVTVKDNELNDKKRISIRKFKGQRLVDIREFWEKDGEYLPTKKGCSLTVELWEKFKKHISDIDEALENMT